MPVVEDDITRSAEDSTTMNAETVLWPSICNANPPSTGPTQLGHAPVGPFPKAHPPGNASREIVKAVIGIFSSRIVLP